MSFFVLLALTTSVFASTAPAELYSPLVSSKVLATAQAQGVPTKFPQNTDQGPQGNWQYYTADQWTSGFFPDLNYKMNDRAKLCPSTVDTADWVGLGRAWSTPLTALEFTNHLQHDVGFVSYPFVSELAM